MVRKGGREGKVKDRERKTPQEDLGTHTLLENAITWRLFLAKIQHDSMNKKQETQRQKHKFTDQPEC